VLTVADGKVARQLGRAGARGDVLIEGRLESAVEILEGLSAGAIVLRGTVGALRDGTQVTLAATPAAPAAPAPAR
jgi:membrane fusion protein, multidrug efflux system